MNVFKKLLDGIIIIPPKKNHLFLNRALMISDYMNHLFDQYQIDYQKEKDEN